MNQFLNKYESCLRPCKQSLRSWSSGYSWFKLMVSQTTNSLVNHLKGGLSSCKHWRLVNLGTHFVRVDCNLKLEQRTTWPIIGNRENYTQILRPMSSWNDSKNTKKMTIVRKSVGYPVTSHGKNVETVKNATRTELQLTLQSPL